MKKLLFLAVLLVASWVGAPGGWAEEKTLVKADEIVGGIGRFTYYYQGREAAMYQPEQNLLTDLKGRPLTGVLAFYNQGHLDYEAPYKDGLQDGLYKQYTFEGILLREVPYEKGIIQGTVKIHSIDGRLLEEKIYKDGVLIEEKQAAD